jgi:hypothetical protein
LNMALTQAGTPSLSSDAKCNTPPPI